MATTQGIKLDEDIRSRLKELAKQKQRSPHWLMRTAIARFLEEEERYEREKQEDMERWQKYQLDGHSISHERAREWLSKLAQGEPEACPS